MTIGILAYGSLPKNPGAELDPCIVRRTECRTPFRAEFARSSRKREGAPTLVPVKKGGAFLDASVLVLKDAVNEQAARDMLYRRETDQVGKSVTYCDSGAQWIRSTPVPGLDVCVYTALNQCIDPLTPEHLAELAIASAEGEAGARRRDGISYLKDVKELGVNTPLMPGYEQEVLRQTAAMSLEEAWDRVRSGR